MRTHRWISALTLAAGLALAACGDAADAHEEPVGYSADGQGTAVNDTTPYRPGSP